MHDFEKIKLVVEHLEDLMRQEVGDEPIRTQLQLWDDQTFMATCIHGYGPPGEMKRIDYNWRDGKIIRFLYCDFLTEVKRCLEETEIGEF